MTPLHPAATASARFPTPVAVLALGLATLVVVAGCTGAGPRESSAFASGQQVAIQGTVSSVDLSPMAYDGNAVVVVASDTHGPVTVQFPARRNLCPAQGFDLLPELKTGDRVAVLGEASGPGDLHVCQSATHRLQRLD